MMMRDVHAVLIVADADCVRGDEVHARESKLSDREGKRCRWDR